ncbi:DUF4332 domain-containing protein [Rhodoligotrophos defluvii]|uniref:DUF4332 domain-containing protein n=1 Tax=Rhodoligotrophos defluvii TaxID=2561934 RepID=UPI001EF13A62|nr:DUF4332 domain-containing protein [Rhodoligotrophos defluvii]
MDGVDQARLERLNQAGIRSHRLLLSRAKDRRGRRQLAAETGICEALILRWANMADLMRIRGIGQDYSELLQAGGVETVKDLRNRNPGRLAAALSAVNAQQRLVREAPGEKRVANWIAQAKQLPIVITH